MYPPLIEHLIEKFQVLPSVGPKTAEQYVFALKKLSKEEIHALAKAIQGLITLTTCALCNALTDEGKYCTICRDDTRKRNVLMVLESEPDMESIEKTKRYPGLYYLLGEVNKFVSPPLRGSEINEVAIQALVKRLKESKPAIEEIILAFDVTPQMELSLFEIKQALKKAGLGETLKISRLGHGLPTGADLRYADTQTILGALKHREKM